MLLTERRETARAVPRFQVDLLQLLLEELQHERPRFLRGLQIRAAGAGLREHEAVAGALVGVHLVALAQLLHRGFGARDGRADPRVVAGIEAEHRRLDVRERRLLSTVRGPWRVAVVDDGRVQRRLRGGIAEAARTAPTEA